MVYTEFVGLDMDHGGKMDKNPWAPHIRINGIKYKVDKYKELSYEQILTITKVPFGTSVVYLSTKGPKDCRRAGILELKQKVTIEDGLDISAYSIQQEELA